MASIEKRGEFWRARVRIKGFPEKTQRFTSKTAAARWARQIETELSESEYIDTSDFDHITLADILERYLKEITPTKRSSEVVRHSLSANIAVQLVNVRSAFLALSFEERARVRYGSRTCCLDVSDENRAAESLQ
jgi:hypothetical protein